MVPGGSRSSWINASAHLMAGECQHFGHMCGTLGLAGMRDISELCLSHASRAHTCTCVYTSVHPYTCPRGSCMCQCRHVHVACATQISACAHPAHTWAHTRHSLAHACACVHPHLLPAAVCPGASGMFAPWCVLVWARVLFMADAQALFPPSLLLLW